MTHEGQRTTGGSRERSAPTEREHARGVSGRAREVAEQGREAAEKAGGKVQELAEEKKSSVVNRVSHVANAFRVAAESLADEQEGRLSEYADRAADRVDRIAGYVERKDMRSLVSDLRHTARRNPSVFLGGGFVAGLLVGRFLRSATPDDDGDDDGYSSPGRAAEFRSLPERGSSPVGAGGEEEVGRSRQGPEERPVSPTETTPSRT